MPNNAALSLVPRPGPQGLSLFELEDQIQAMIDTGEGGVPPELEQQFVTEFESLLKAAEEKRDRFHQFLAFLESQVDLADKEIDRLRERKATIQKWIERLEGIGVRVIQGLPKDKKGKYQRLMGTTVTLSIAKNPDSVDITDETQIDLEFQTFRISMPARLWEPILDQLDIDLRRELLETIAQPDVTSSKTLIHEAFDRGIDVAGARLITDKYRLVRK